MKKFVALLVLVILSLGGGIVWFFLQQEVVSFAPNWEVSQSWKVQVISGQEKRNRQELVYRVWNFMVTEKTIIDDMTFYTIKVSANIKGQPNFVLKFVYPDLSLVSIATYEKNRLLKEEKSSSHAFFFNAQGARIIPLDFLDLRTFDLSRRQRNRNLRLEKREEFVGEKSSLMKLRYEFRQQILAIGSVRILKISASDSKKKTESFQYWEAERPWWTNAKRNINGKRVSEGILIE